MVQRWKDFVRWQFVRLSPCAPRKYGAASEVLQSTGGGASMFAAFGDSCINGSFQVIASGSALRNPQSNPKAQSSAYATIIIFAYNSCTQTYYYETAVAPVQYSSIVDKSNLPKTITVSVQDAQTLDGIDSISFNMTLNSTGLTYSVHQNDQMTYANPNSNVHVNSDGQQGLASVTTLTASTRKLGPLAIGDTSANIYFFSSQTVTVTH
jgi:hypothetical protein